MELRKPNNLYLMSPKRDVVVLGQYPTKTIAKPVAPVEIEQLPPTREQMMRKL